MEPHLRDLRYFVAVAEELHFTHAAENLHIAQPTLSRQIRQLEDQLGVTLLDRDQRTVALTVAGKELLEAARKLLSMWDETVARLTAAGETLRVGLQTAIGRGILAELEGVGGHKLEFHSTQWSDPTCGLASRESDLALVWLPMLDAERYEWRVLRAEPRWVVMPEAHPLAKAETVAFADLLDQPFIALPSEAGPQRDFWLAADSRGGRRPVVGAEASTAEENVEEIGLGRGLCLIAEENVPMYQWPGITARKTDLEPCELAIAWRADDDRATVRDFVALAAAG